MSERPFIRAVIVHYWHEAGRVLVRTNTDQEWLMHKDQVKGPSWTVGGHGTVDLDETGNAVSFKADQ